jgi:hypothetical protein
MRRTLTRWGARADAGFRHGAHACKTFEEGKPRAPPRSRVWRRGSWQQAGGCVRSSIGKHRKMQLAKNCRVSHHVDLGDLATCDREPGDIAQPSIRSHDDSDCAVHQRRLCEPGKPQEGSRLPDHSRRPTNYLCALSHMMLERGAQSIWTKTLQDSGSPGTIDLSASFIVLGVHGAEAQARSAGTY